PAPNHPEASGGPMTPANPERKLVCASKLPSLRWECQTTNGNGYGSFGSTVATTQFPSPSDGPTNEQLPPSGTDVVTVTGVPKVGRLPHDGLPPELATNAGGVCSHAAS